MIHKNIAVLMTALDTDSTAKTLKGIRAFGKENNCNISVFLWFTGAFDKEKHNLGEVNIVNLPNLNLFDGVIVFSNVFHIDANRRKIEELLETVTCPVVCIGDRVGDCYFVSTDNYAAMKELVTHIIEKHKKTNIHFVRGVKGNGDAEARFKAYEDALSEHDIPILMDRITQGDFYVTGGELAARDILSSKLPFPEAIVCANDTMALTLTAVLIEKGYKIPEDVIVTGYDYTSEGRNHCPSLTSVRSRSDELGKMACKIIVDVLDGKEVPKETYLPDQVMYSESCGCDISTREERYQKSFNSTENGQRKLIHQMIILEKNVMESVGYDGWYESVQEYIRQVNPTEFYMCVNENFIENIFELDVLDQEEMSIEEKLAYSDNMNVIMAYKNGTFMKKKPIASERGFDELFMDTEEPRTYVFTPFHYLDRNFGYFVFVDSSITMENPLLISWLIYMGDAIENIRKQSLLKYTMSRLDDMYIRDSLTGVYNRFGMDRFFDEIKRKYAMSKVKLQLSFIDIDNLKKINDEYGHEEGDFIITTAAKILQKKAGKYQVIRYGGDEFVVMGVVRSEADVEKYWRDVDEEIKKYNTQNKKHAELSLSYGYDVYDIDSKIKLEDCINIADKRMYKQKNEKKEKEV